MALSLVITIGTPCSGGNHFPITGTLAGAFSAVRTIPFTRQDIGVPVTDDDIEVFMRVLIRLYRNQLAGNATPAQIKAAIEAKTLDLTVS